MGSDGIVLASDKVFLSLGMTDKDFDDQTMGRKIVHVPRHEIAYAFAGDWFSQDIGVSIALGMSEHRFDFEDIHNSVTSILAERYNRQPMPDTFPPRSVLLIFYGSHGLQLWRVAIEKHAAYPIHVTEGITIAGATGNSARFFQRYARPNLPVESLRFLATHIVCVASAIAIHTRFRYSYC